MAAPPKHRFPNYDWIQVAFPDQEPPPPAALKFTVAKLSPPEPPLYVRCFRSLFFTAIVIVLLWEACLETSVVLQQVAVTALVLGLALWVHFIIDPYVHSAQNKLRNEAFRRQQQREVE